jgi:hypothetical protein
MHGLANMSAYRKFIQAWIIIMSVALASGVLGLYLSPWFLVPFFAAVVVLPHALLKAIVCPSCGTPVTYQGSLGGFKISGDFVHRRCRNCGWDLKREK